MRHAVPETHPVRIRSTRPCKRSASFLLTLSRCVLCELRVSMATAAAQERRELQTLSIPESTD